MRFVINVAKLPGASYNANVKGVPLARPELGAPPSGPLGLIERGMRSVRAHLFDPYGALNIDGLDVTVRALAMAVIVLLNFVASEASDGSYLSAWIVAGLIIYNM